MLPTPEVVNNVVLYSALFDVDNPDHDLMTQMSAQVFFVVSQAENLPVVPMSALRPLPGQRGGEGRPRYVLRVLENGQPVRRVVEVAALNRVNAAIAAGLQAGEEVILDLPVRAQNAAAQGGPPRVPRL